MYLKIIRKEVLQCNREDIIVLITFIGTSPALMRFCSNRNYAVKAKFTNFPPLTALGSHIAA